MECNKCSISFIGAKCPDGCLESRFVTTLDDAGYMKRREDEIWLEDVYDFALEAGMLIEDEDIEDVQGTIERICKDHSDGWFPFLQAPLIYDVTRRYGEFIRAQQDRDGAYDSSR